MKDIVAVWVFAIGIDFVYLIVSSMDISWHSAHWSVFDWIGCFIPILIILAAIFYTALRVFNVIPAID